jgi:hypothetical protein
MIASCVAKPVAPASPQASIVDRNVSLFPAQHQLRMTVPAVSNVPKSFRVGGRVIGLGGAAPP